MKLTIEPRHGKPFEVNVEPKATVQRLKSEIEQVGAISAAEQFLTFRRLWLEDGIALREYGVTEDAVVTLNVRLAFQPNLVPVRVLLPGDTTGSFVVTARATQTVRQFKDLLKQTGHVTAPFELCCNGFVLEDDHQLGEYGMKMASNFSILSRLPRIRKSSGLQPPSPPSPSPPTQSPYTSLISPHESVYEEQQEEGSGTAVTIFFKPWDGDLMRVRLGKQDDLNALRRISDAQLLQQMIYFEKQRVLRFSLRVPSKERGQQNVRRRGASAVPFRRVGYNLWSNQCIYFDATDVTPTRQRLHHEHPSLTKTSLLNPG